MPVKRGIYIVANRKSELLAISLVYSIRKSGCTLPIRLIPFGGQGISSQYLLQQTELYEIDKFPREAIAFVDKLKEVLTYCPPGFLNRFLPWFGDWDEFIYTDNDIVALMNWETMFGYLADYDFVHADGEYTNKGKYTYLKPGDVQNVFGENALNSLINAGHFVIRRKKDFIGDMMETLEWFRQHPDIPMKHDQAFINIAALIGKWNKLNLCHPPHNWLDSWSGNYHNSLVIIQSIQQNGKPRFISHIHYAGMKPAGLRAIEDLLLAATSSKSRLQFLVYAGLLKLSGISYLVAQNRRVMNKLSSILKRKN